MKFPAGVAELAVARDSKSRSPCESVGSTPSSGVAPANRHRRDVDLALVPAGTINGRITDQQGRPLQGAMVILTWSRDEQEPLTGGAPAMTVSSATGDYSIGQVAEGSYRIRVTWNDPEALKAKTFARPRSIFYPGTPTLSEAAVVQVRRGETVTGIDIVFTRTDTASISGHVAS